MPRSWHEVAEIFRESGHCVLHGQDLDLESEALCATGACPHEARHGPGVSSVTSEGLSRLEVTLDDVVDGVSDLDCIWACRT